MKIIDPVADYSIDDDRASWVVSIKDYGAGMQRATAVEWKWKDPDMERPPRERDEPVDTAENRRRAADRARKEVYDAMMMLRVDRLITLTFRDNVTNITAMWACFKRFSRNVRLALPDRDFQYVAVPERQKRGAWHIHLAVKGWWDVAVLRECWRAALGGGTGRQSPGNVDIKWLGRAAVKYRVPAIARYLSKYLSKDADSVPVGRRRYSKSRGIPAPVKSTAVLRGQGDVDATRLGLEVLFFEATGRKPLYCRIVDVEGAAGRRIPVWVISSYATGPVGKVGTMYRRE